MKPATSIWYKLKKIILWMIVLHLVYIFFCKWINPPITITQLTSLIKGEGLRRDYISISNMGSSAKLAVMSAEDQLFPDHNGFDVKRIKMAIKYNKKYPKRRRGASTISQQVAKNVFLWQGGGYFRKGLETYFTFMIETFWSKKRILETYLNVAEMGEGIFGIQAAAKFYFNKDAKNLSRSEAAMIASCLPNPVKYTVKPACRYVTVRSAIIKRQMEILEADTDIAALLK
jgi:monofunctional glycosyltransferase